MKWTPCECAAAGWCERHQCLKYDVLFRQCQVSQELFDQWEHGRGPCVPLDLAQTASGGPSLPRRAAHFGAAIVRHAVNGLRQLERAAYDARIAVCRQCPSCDTTRLVCLHRDCGCFLTMKASWASEDCPLGQWPATPTPDGSVTDGSLANDTASPGNTDVDRVPNSHDGGRTT